MTPEQARWIIAHELGIDLAKYGVPREDVERVQALRASMQRGTAVALAAPVGARRARSVPAREVAVGPTRAAVFNSRSLHANVEKSSRKLFVDGHRADAVRKAFQAVNNRVKKVAATSKDGQDLMGHVFRVEAPIMQMTAMSDQTEIDEQRGLMFLMMGAMAGIRNPCTHGDKWVFDSEQEAALDALSFASLLHRFIDRCEDYGN